MMELITQAGTDNSNNDKYQIWQQDKHPIELWSREVILQKLDYIDQNPVSAGFVERPEDWIWSSGRDYEGAKGLLESLVLMEL